MLCYAMLCYAMLRVDRAEDRARSHGRVDLRALAIQQYSDCINTGKLLYCCINTARPCACVGSNTAKYSRFSAVLAQYSSPCNTAIIQQYSAPKSPNVPLRGLMVLKLPPTCHVEAEQHMGCTECTNSHV